MAMDIDVPGATAPLKNATAKGVTLVYAQILPVMAIVSLFPAIPRLFQQFGRLPHAGLLVPMILTVPSLCVALTAPFAGVLADRYGRRALFLAGMTLYVLAGLVPLLTANLAVIVGSRMVLGVAEAVAVTLSSTLIGDYFGENRHKWVSQVGVWITVAGTLLIAAGGALADISWRGPFMVYLAIIPAMIMAYIFIDEPAPRPRGESGVRINAPYPWRTAAIIGAVTLVTSLIYYVEPLNFAAVLTVIGVKAATQIGLIQAATTIGYIAGALAYRRLKGWPISRYLTLAGGFIGVGLGVIGLAHNVAGVALGGVIQQFGSGFVIPALMAWGQELLPLQQRARGMGIWVTTFFMGTFLCPPMVSGVGALMGGLQHAHVMLGAVALVLAAIAFLLGGKIARTRALSQPVSL